jgi:NaMN:DMB phosphoribosyltransferase
MDDNDKNDLQSLAKGSIEPISSTHVEAAQNRQAILTKPAGSLGRLEDIACQIAGIQRTDRPVIENKWIVVAAADHGVVDEGVSAYPQAVTAQMVANFLGGGAAVSALGRQAQANVKIVGAGVANPVPGDTSDLVDRKLANGTQNVAHGTRHPGWLALFRFMKHLSRTFRSPVVGDLDSEDDGPSLTIARLKAKADRHSDKVLTVGSSPDIDEILRHINSK